MGLKWDPAQMDRMTVALNTMPHEEKVALIRHALREDEAGEVVTIEFRVQEVLGDLVVITDIGIYAQGVHVASHLPVLTNVSGS